MVYKIVTDYVRPEGRIHLPVGMSITEVKPGLFVVSSRCYPTTDFGYFEVISFMAMFIKSCCGRVLTATFINDGCAI